MRKAALVHLGYYDKCALYTIELIDKDGKRDDDEFLKFCTRMDDGSRNGRQLTEIEAIIDDIVYETGALESRFRSEGCFDAIPSHDEKDRFWDSDGKDHYGLRLYCKRVNNDILILFNGCSKTDHSPRKCLDCKDHYFLAEDFTNAFLTELNVRHTIDINGQKLETDEEEIIINF